MPALSDAIWDTSSAPGTGTPTLSGTPQAGYAPFSNLANGAVFDYRLWDATNSLYEHGRGVKVSNTTFTRAAVDVVGGSSGAGVLVNFASATNFIVTQDARSIMTRGKVMTPIFKR